MRPLNLVWSIASSELPVGWLQRPDGAVVPTRTGAVDIPIVLQKGGRYRVWIGGSVRGRLTEKIDDRPVGSVSSQLQNAGQWLELGTVVLTAGSHAVAIEVTLPLVMPGTGGDDFPLGPLLLQPQSSETVIAPARPSSLCGRPLDWVEVVAH